MLANNLNNQAMVVVEENYEGKEGSHQTNMQLQMLMDDLEESNEAGVINEQMEANVSKQVENVSALGDSNIVSNRDTEFQHQQLIKTHNNEQVYFSYGATESPQQKIMQQSYASVTLPRNNNNSRTAANDQMSQEGGSGDIRSLSMQS